MGLLVMWAIERIAPDFSSNSAFVRIEPSIPIELSNAFACSIESLPVIASPINSFRSGWETRTIFSISRIRFELVCILPAVSIRRTSILFFFEN